MGVNKETSQRPKPLNGRQYNRQNLCFIALHHMLVIAAGNPPTRMVITRGSIEDKRVRSQAVSRNSPLCVSAAKGVELCSDPVFRGPIKSAIAKVRLLTLLIGGCFSLHSSQIKKEKQSHILVSSQSCGR